MKECQGMPTITLKNIPDELYGKLKEAASAHRRSINSEMIHCLEVVLAPRKIRAEEFVSHLRLLRPDIDPEAVGLDEIQRVIDEGRP
jgi:plasmid stability protein